MLLICFVMQKTFHVSVHASVEDQKDQRYMLPAAPFETVSMLLEKAVKRFNRTLGPDKTQAVDENCILKVCKHPILIHSAHILGCLH